MPPTFCMYHNSSTIRAFRTCTAIQHCIHRAGTALPWTMTPLVWSWGECCSVVLLVPKAGRATLVAWTFEIKLPDSCECTGYYCMWITGNYCMWMHRILLHVNAQDTTACECTGNYCMWMHRILLHVNAQDTAAGEKHPFYWTHQMNMNTIWRTRFKHQGSIFRYVTSAMILPPLG
jgi:hypothetical protein